MKLIIMICFVVQFLIYGRGESEVHIGYQVTVEVPMEYIKGFIGRAFLMETVTKKPNFKAALSVEAAEVNRKYTCALDVFLGDVRVWSSVHLWKFYTADKCMIELTDDGDLRLTGRNGKVGWRTGTNGQHVQRLLLPKTGNLVLLDGLNFTKWQSFNFPTNVILWGQKLHVSNMLTSFPTSNSTSFYSFEIQHNKIALYLNDGPLKYFYWEFNPSKNRNITFIKLGSTGLKLFNEKHKKIAQIVSSQKRSPLRFLALGNVTGNLGLYHYSPNTGKFEASFQALNNTCDLPLACKSSNICTLSNTCSCIRVLTSSDNKKTKRCSLKTCRSFCNRNNQLEMVELKGVNSVLRNKEPNKVNVSKQVCLNTCVDDCKCVAALYFDSKECYLYELIRGVKQVDKENGMSYFIKVPKNSEKGRTKDYSVKKWVLILVGVIDGLVILVISGGVSYFVIWKRRMFSSNTENHT